MKEDKFYRTIGHIVLVILGLMFIPLWGAIVSVIASLMNGDMAINEYYIFGCLWVAIYAIGAVKYRISVLNVKKENLNS